MEEDYQTFDEWWNDNKFPAELKSLMKLAWNAALANACDFFGYWEGTDYGAEMKFLAN